MKKILISVAPVDAADTIYDPIKTAEDVIRCYHAGAAMVHLHVRDKKGKLTSDLALLEQTVSIIRKETDMVIEISTGGVSDLTIEERCSPCTAPWIEANSLNVGSVNLGEAVYQNPIQDVKYCVKQILENHKWPEIEVFELGMINTVLELSREFSFPKPILFAFVFGHGGEMPATPQALQHMRTYLQELFPEENQVLWGYTEAHRKDWQMVAKALDNGASAIRIGFEDSHMLSPEETAASNDQLVKRAVELVRERKMEPMTPCELRELMKGNVSC